MSGLNTPAFGRGCSCAESGLDGDEFGLPAVPPLLPNSLATGRAWWGFGLLRHRFDFDSARI